MPLFWYLSVMEQSKERIPIIGMEAFNYTAAKAGNMLYHHLEGKQFIRDVHKHDFFILMLIEQSQGTHTIDFIEHIAGKKQLHLLFPGQVHKWMLDSSTQAYQLMLDRPLFEAFSTSLGMSFLYYQNNPVVNLSDSTFQKIAQEIHAISDELLTETSHNEINLLRLHIIALLLKKEAENQSIEIDLYKNKPVLYKFRNLIDYHYKSQKTVRFYAQELNISPNYLNVLCKKHLNVPASFLIHNRVILESKRLIQASELSIKEIAFELGYEDPAYFSNFFKSHTGSSPRQFWKK